MKIRWTELAASDLTQICDYIEGHSTKTTARRVARSVYERAGALAQFAERGRQGRIPGTRELVFAGLPYLAVYRVNKNTVEILRILHGAQEWP
ncbi:MAG: type II toxin-antitoxin system RelE/ParE family toxin [Terriglobales bacterium]|jgi:addiction module RelE/StbE family toxin|nr:type II toxin-antitoxin system RelE/ParE family toxin [Terriglobales bacterium]